jgi:hypothetical protein
MNNETATGQNKKGNVMTNAQRKVIELEDKRLEQEERAWDLYIDHFSEGDRIDKMYHSTIVKMIADDRTLDLFGVEDAKCLLDRCIEHLEEYSDNS